MNNLKTAFWMALLTSVAVAAGYLIGGTAGTVVAFSLALLMNGFAYWFSDRVALAVAGAREVSVADAPALHRMVESLAVAFGTPKPRVYMSSDTSPNAFATGRNPRHAAVCVTAGLLQALNEEELRGVLAHELAHVRNRDILISSVVAVLAGWITMLATFAQRSLWLGGANRDDERGGGISGLVGLLLMVVLAPIAATLVQLAISRSREYEADRTGALVGRALPLASALQKLDLATHRLPSERAQPAFAHLYIVNPLSSQVLAGLFSTHPPVQERVRRLETMARQASWHGRPTAESWA